MGFFDDLVDKAKSGIDAVVTEGKKFKNANFMKATVAACVRVAAADGTIDSDEKAKTLGFMQRNEHLKVFTPSDIIKNFNTCTEHLEFDKTIGTGELNKMIIKIKGKPEAALLVQVCCAVGEADGDFDANEKAVVKEIASLLDMATSI